MRENIKYGGNFPIGFSKDEDDNNSKELTGSGGPDF